MNCRDCEYWDYPLLPRIDLKFDGFCDHPKQEKREYYTKCPIEKERCQCAKCNNFDILLGADMQLLFICKAKNKLINGLQDLWNKFKNGEMRSGALFWYKHEVLNYTPFWCPKCSLEALREDSYDTIKLACDIAIDNNNERIKNSKNMSEIEGVNHPSHYNQGKVECIDAMESAYGIDDVIAFCKCNAFKYQWRAGHKDNESIEKDIAKAQWYQNKALELMKKRDK